MSSRSPFRNGTYAAAEYAAPQLGMLLAAPLLLHRLGAAQLGIWMLASAAVSSGTLVSAGFGDAAVKYVAMYQGRNDGAGVERVLRGMLLVNLCVGGLLAAGLACVAPLIAAKMAHMDAELARVCVVALRIGCLLLLLRSLDGVFVSVLRGMEQYAAASRVSLCVRFGTLVCAVALAAMGRGVVAIMVATLVVVAAGVAAQVVRVRQAAPDVNIFPSTDRETLRMLAGYGCYTWLQVGAALLFGQADRVFVGVLLGPEAVAYYGLCTQATQPIHGLVSAGFHALFPHLSARMETGSMAQLRDTVRRALRANVLLAVGFALPLMAGSHLLLRVWVGNATADAVWLSFATLALSYGLLAMNVTAHFTLLAFGEVRRVTWVNLSAAIATLLLMVTLMPRFGLIGAATARLLYGPITLTLYPAVFRRLRRESIAVVLPHAMQEAA